MTIAPLPKEQVLERSLPGPKLLAALVTQKAVDKIPLNRTQKMFKRHGMDFPIQTLCRWEEGAHQLLFPLSDRIRQMVLSADTVNLDDTGLRVKHKKTKGGVIKAKIWVFIGRKYAPDGDVRKTQEFSFFLYTPTWEAKYPEEFLMGASVTLRGMLIEVMNALPRNTLEMDWASFLAGCLMHARRPFHQAFECDDPLASFFIERIQAIYKYAFNEPHS